MISNDTIEEVKQRLDIVEVISDFVNLKKSGQNYKALSPFTDEKTPSFFVSPTKQIYKCFSTGKGGDAISFIMEHDGLNYLEAIRHLADKYGIEIKETEQTDEEIQAQSERDSLYIVLNYAKDYFKDILKNHDEGRSIGLTYFRERGFTDPIIEKFELGYSLEGWEELKKDALKNGHSEAILEKAGLIINKGDQQSGRSGSYDRFRGRVVFPIHSIGGKVIAFGARILKKDVKQPKYINSPETEVYHKSHILYGISQAKQAIRREDNCYLVEGYTDVISLHQSDIENVVASSGTSLTTEQIRLISRFTNNVTVLFDGDKAGIKASLRGIDMIIEGGLNVRACQFPEGEDPDSYSRQLGSTAFKAYLDEHTQDFITFKASIYTEESAKDPSKKADTIKEIVSSIAKLPDPIKRAVYIKELSDILDIDESVLVAHQNKLLIEERRKKQKESAPEQELPLIEDVIEEKVKLQIDHNQMLAIQERECIRLLVNYGHYKIEDDYHLYDYLLQELDNVEFSVPVLGEIFNAFKVELEKGNVADSTFFMDKGSEEVKSTVVDLITEKYEVSENWENSFEIIVPKETDVLENAVFSNILRFKFRLLQKLIDDNLRKLKEEKDDKELENLLKIHSELKKSEMEVANQLGIVVTK
ncbi:MAG: DNA primase [Bacteroidota bacterium]